MAFQNPYRQHNYMGDHSTDGDALTFIQTAQWDSNKNGTGLPESGMFYYNRTSGKLRFYDDIGWQTIATGILWQDSVLDQLNTPPVGPPAGARYLINTVPTGAWVGHANAIAEYDGAGWIFTEAAEGMAAWVEDVNLAYQFNGTAWVALPSSANHNDLLGIQGGAAGDYYHFTSTQHTDLTDGGTTTLHAHTLDAGYDAGGAGAGRSVTADSGAVAITVSNNANNVALDLTQNDITNNPAAATITNAGTGASLAMAGATRKIASNAGNLAVETVVSGTLALNAVALLDVNAGAGLDIDVTGTTDLLTTGALSIDATGASNLSITSGTLTVSTITSGTLEITSAGLVDVNAAADMDVDVTGSFDVLATSTFSIDGTGASNVTATSGNLNLSTLTTGNVIIDAVSMVDVNAGANCDIDVTGTFDMLSTSSFSIDGTGASNISATSGNLTVSTLTTGTLILDAVALLDINAAANIDVDVTGSFDVLSTGVFSIDGTGISNVSATSGNLTLSTITSGSLILTGAGLVDVNAGANLDVDVTGTVDVLATSTFAIAGTGNSSLGVTSGNLTLSTATTGNIVLSPIDRVGIGIATPSSWVDIQKAGTAKANLDILELTNSGNDVDMDGTVTSILFNQFYYDAGTPAPINTARVSVGTETDWTSTASTQDAYMAFVTALDGTLMEQMRIRSSGNIGMGLIAPTTLLNLQRAGTVKTNLDVLKITNSGNAADMNGTETSILFGQYCYDIAVPSVVSSGRITIGTETDWTVIAGTQDSYMSINLAKSGTVFEAGRWNSSGYLGVGTTAPTSRIDAEIIGGSKVTTDIIEITNKYASADMAATGAALFFNLAYYDAFQAYIAPAGRIAVIAEGNWQSNVNTRDSAMVLQTCLNGTVGEKCRINSAGHFIVNYNASVTASSLLTVHTATDINLRVDTDASALRLLGSTDNGGSFCPMLVESTALALNSTSGGNVGIGLSSPTALLDLQRVGTVKTVTDLLELTNSGNASDMDGTGTGILFNQFYYDAGTPAVADAGRILVATETDWTSTANTQDSYMAFQTALDGTVAEKFRITSGGKVGIGTINPAELMSISGTSPMVKVVDAGFTSQPIFLGSLNLGSYVNVGLWHAAVPSSTNHTLRGDGINTFFNSVSSGNLYFTHDNVIQTTIRGSTGYVGINTTTPVDRLTVWGGNTSIVDPTDLGSEMLTNGALTSGTGWSVTNDCVLASDKATWTYSAGTASTLYQPLAVAGARPSCGSRWYKFVYTVSGVSGTPTASINTNFAATSTALTLSAGTQTTYVWSKDNPFGGDFTITSTLTAGQAFSLDDLSLKEVMGGDLTYEGTLYTNGATQVTRILYLGDDETWTLPTAVAGILDVWSKSEYMRVHVSDNGTVTSIYVSSNAAVTDSDGNLCVYTSGAGAIIKNRRGVAITVGYKYVYSPVYEIVA